MFFLKLRFADWVININISLHGSVFHSPEQIPPSESLVIPFIIVLSSSIFITRASPQLCHGGLLEDYSVLVFFDERTCFSVLSPSCFQSGGEPAAKKRSGGSSGAVFVL